MTDEKKKEKLRAYLIAVDRLRIKCDDAARWESMSFGPNGSVHAGGGKAQPDEIKETAIQMRQDCEAKAYQVRDLRKKMDAAFACMRTDRLRDILECKYIDGMGDKALCEKKHYSDRHMRRLLTQALRELEECSSFFS